METKSEVYQKGRTRNMVSLQEQVLQEAVQKNKDITLILVRGFHIKGIVKGYDSYSILMECEGKQQLVYKHTISTIRL
ncbi:RNA chaperone Hfq [Bacillus pseudomycoides]|uniref:RNA chaperone Hfq n=1 Tax=Bacillus pseudomycoides TaxID=64104 RepID=UPI000BF148BA|nr:RNA chaperone Hfq [Bacillus pseudomycoides]PEK70441.1 RNA chaperone Hfq [Bacillus pseudomycoides]